MKKFLLIFLGAILVLATNSYSQIPYQNRFTEEQTITDLIGNHWAANAWIMGIATGLFLGILIIACTPWAQLIKFFRKAVSMTVLILFVSLPIKAQTSIHLDDMRAIEPQHEPNGWIFILVVSISVIIIFLKEIGGALKRMVS